MAMVVWLFVALILTQSYTASLTSMLTISRLKPCVASVESLIKSKAKVGCDTGSFMAKYLEEEVGFDSANVLTYTSVDAFPQALSNGTIKAVFIEIPAVKLFLDYNPKGFMVTGPTYEIGGYAYVFPKGSDLAAKVSEEILKLRESGMLRKLEDSMLSSPKRSSLEPDDDDENGRLRPDCFWGLFVITGGISTLALALFLAGQLHKNWQCRFSPRVRSVSQTVKVIFSHERNPTTDDHGLRRRLDDKFRRLRRCNTV